MICGTCDDQTSATTCAAGMTCENYTATNAACARYCCTNADCGSGTCTMMVPTADGGTTSLFGPVATALGLCTP
jgi:hypothetical protein